MKALDRAETQKSRCALENTWERQAALFPAPETVAFVGFVVHEVRTPLTVILGNAHRLSRTFPEQDVGDSVDEIVRAAQRLDQVLEDWTELAAGTRIDGGVQPFRLDTVVRHVIDEHRRSDSQRRFLLRGGSRAYVAVGSPSWTAQILGNLLSNAEKYSPAETSIEVELLPERCRELAVHVRDRGIGLSDETEELFKPFRRSPAARRLAGGMGMGLAASRQLATAQGGRIWAQARDGGGSDFAFTVMAAVPAAKLGRRRSAPGTAETSGPPWSS